MSELDLVGTVEAAAILGLDQSTIARWSDERLKPEERKLVPAMRLPGKNGPRLFHRTDVLQLREQLAAERTSA